MTEATTTIDQATITTLETAYREAKSRHDALARKAAELDAQIRQALATAARQKADAARAGEAPSSVPADLEAEELRDRQRRIPLDLWAGNLAATEAELELRRAEDLYWNSQQPAATAALKETKAGIQEAREAFQAAQAHEYAVSSRQATAHSKVKILAQRVAELETAYPTG